jgi:hypothetical protein
VKIAGGRRALFDAASITAIHQGSGGVLRRANALARGGLLAAQREEKDAVRRAPGGAGESSCRPLGGVPCPSSVHY